MWFQRLYSDPERGLGFQGCSSHSGRRTFITRAARKVSEAGGSRGGDHHGTRRSVEGQACAVKTLRLDQRDSEGCVITRGQTLDASAFVPRDLAEKLIEAGVRVLVLGKTVAPERG